MNVDVITDIVVDAPRERVAAFASNPDNAPAWYKNIERVEWKSPPPVQVGSKVAFVARFLGRRLEYTYEVVELEPGERLVMRTAEGPFPMETSYEWASVSEGQTRMVLRNRGAPAGFGRLFAPIMSWAMRRENKKDLEALKRILET